MVRCIDCIHNALCYSMGIIKKPSEGLIPHTCGDFKDKANFAKVKHGEWKEEYPTSDNIVCSVCGGMWNVLDNCTETFDFCPHCGAKMDGGDT